MWANRRTLLRIWNMTNSLLQSFLHKKQRNTEEKKMKKRTLSTPTYFFNHLRNQSRLLQCNLHLLKTLHQRIRLLQLLLQAITTSRHLNHHLSIHLLHLLKPHQSNNQSMNRLNQLIFRSKSTLSQPWLPVLLNKLKTFRSQSSRSISS